MEYATNSDFSDPQTYDDLTATSYTTTDSLPDGRYFWRVRAVDRDGEASDFSAINEFAIKLSTPTGGFIDVTVTPSGNIYVDDSQRIGLQKGAKWMRERLGEKQ